MQTIYLAGGCFWGVEKYLKQFDGVVSTEVGYANGPDPAPSYQDVCASSGHAESVKVVYDESKITLTTLLRYYFMVIDPLIIILSHLPCFHSMNGLAAGKTSPAANHFYLKNSTPALNIPMS